MKSMCIVHCIHSNPTQPPVCECLDGCTQLERPVESPAGVVHAHEPEEDAQVDDDDVVDHDDLGHGVVFEHQVEDGGPDEREHASGEAADEAHQEGEVGDDHGEQNGHHHHADTEGQPVNLHVKHHNTDNDDGVLFLDKM